MAVPEWGRQTAGTQMIGSASASLAVISHIQVGSALTGVVYVLRFTGARASLARSGSSGGERSLGSCPDAESGARNRALSAWCRPSSAGMDFRALTRTHDAPTWTFS